MCFLFYDPFVKTCPKLNLNPWRDISKRAGDSTQEFVARNRNREHDRASRTTSLTINFHFVNNGFKLVF